MRWPAEWEPHEAVWIGFPGDPVEWPIGMDDARREVAAFARAVSDNGAGEQVILVCRDCQDAEIARSLVGDRIAILIEPFGDIWFRDTGPVITLANDNRVANNFGFNGWGRKYEMIGDQGIGGRLAERYGLAVAGRDWILEGGAIDGDGAGRLLTTEQCLLNPNRNLKFGKETAEAGLTEALGCREIIWLGQGLTADHTDGHVDNLARFVATGAVAIPEADTDDDPNTGVFEDAAARVADADINIVRVPSVGRMVIGSELVPASYMNFYIGNTTVVVPQYGGANDAKAVEQIAALFPDHRTLGLSSTSLLRGGGSFHCISQQIPAAPSGL